MTNILMPGYLYFDGFKYTTSQNLQGPPGPTGATGATGPAGTITSGSYVLSSPLTLDGYVTIKYLHTQLGLLSDGYLTVNGVTTINANTTVTTGHTLTANALEVGISGGSFIVNSGVTTSFASNPIFYGINTFNGNSNFNANVTTDSSALVTVNGSFHVTSSGDSTFSSNMTLDSGSTFFVDGDINTTGTTTFNGDVNSNAHLTIGGFVDVTSGVPFQFNNGAHLIINSGATFNAQSGSTAVISSNSVSFNNSSANIFIDGSVFTNNNFTSNGFAQFSGGVQVDTGGGFYVGTGVSPTFNEFISLDNKARVQYKYSFISGTLSDSPINPAFFSYIVVTSLTGAGSVKITDTDPHTGDFFWVTNQDSSDTLTVKDPGGSTISTVGPNNTLVCIHVGSGWQKLFGIVGF